VSLGTQPFNIPRLGDRKIAYSRTRKTYIGIVMNSSLKATKEQLLLVEDEPVLRSLLVHHISLRYSGVEILQASDGEVAWDLFRRICPAYCIVDLHLPGMCGTTLLRLIGNHHSPTRVLVFTSHVGSLAKDICDRIPDILLVNKTLSLDDLDVALEALVCKDGSGLARFRAREVMDPLMTLTAREQTVLSMIAEGLTLSSIARSMGISIHTAHTHRRNIMQKLDLHSSTRLARYAIENGISMLRGDVTVACQQP